MQQITLTTGSRLRAKYDLLANQLSTDIWNGKYHHKIPGLRKLAEKYDVHLKTMAKAVNRLVDRGILYVERGVGTFINDEVVKAKVLTLWLLSSKWQRELGTLRSELITGLREGLDEYDFEVEFRMVEMEAVRKGVWLKSFPEGTFRGIVTTGIGLKYRDDVTAIIEQGIPCISLLYREKGVNFVDADNIGGAYEAVNYLISLGHRSIAFVSASLDVPNMRDNLIGYRKALDEKNIGYREAMIKELNSFAPENVARMTEELLGNNPQITAIFTTGDELAVEIVRTLREMGLRVPEDISVVGFDDLPVGRYSYPPLTTVKQPFFEVGKLAAERLVGLMEGRIEEVADILPAELIIRESTAPAKERKREG